MLRIIVDPKVLFLFWRENDEISLLNKLITGKKKIHMYILEDIRLSNKKVQQKSSQDLKRNNITIWKQFLYFQEMASQFDPT